MEPEKKDLEVNNLDEAADQSPASIDEYRSKLEALEAELKKKDAEILRLQDSVRRWEEKILEIREYVKKQELETAAVRERAQKDVGKQVTQKLAGFLTSFLQIQDNLERSLQFDSSQANVDSLAEGMSLIAKQMQDILKDSGVEKIDLSSKVFDPTLHEAIATQPVESEKDDDKIIEEFRPGYRLGEFVLRPAQVVVGKKM